MKVLYLACPYSHPDPNIMEERYSIATKAAAILITRGHFVFSPLTHSHPIHAFAPMSHEFWLRFDAPFMDMCDELAVIKAPGWEFSKGIEREISYFKRQHKVITYYTLEDLGL